MSDSEEGSFNCEDFGAPASGGSDSESKEPIWKQHIPKGKVLSLQDYCTRSISRRWADLPEATHTALCSDGTVPESVQRRFTKLIAQERAKDILKSLMPETGLFGKENYAERLVLLKALTKQMGNWKHQEVLKSKFYDWYNSLAEYLDMDEESRIKGPDDFKLEALDWRVKKHWRAFPRRFCTSQIQLDQLQDIFERVRVVNHEYSNTEIGKLIKKSLGGDPDGSTWENLFQLNGPGEIELTYTYAYAMPKYGDISTDIVLKFGREMYGARLFYLRNDHVDDQFEPVLLALKRRLLDGAPHGGKKAEDKESITNHQFMTLLLICTLGADAEGWQHYTRFVGYFEDGHQDDYYE